MGVLPTVVVVVVVVVVAGVVVVGGPGATDITDAHDNHVLSLF